MNFWPDGYRCCVNLSFDYDANSTEFWRTPLDLVSQSKGRFGPNTAIGRVLNLLDKHEIKSTFFTPGWTVDTYTDTCEEILSRGHELGAHGYMHEKLAELSLESERSVFERSLESFERIGVKPEGFRAPYWLISDRTLSHVQEYGFRYDSNFMDDDMPYMLMWRGTDTGLVELPVEWMLDDWPHFESLRMTPDEVYGVWKAEFEGIREFGRYMGLTCHPQCIGRAGRIKVLDRLLTEMAAKGDVWFTNCNQLADWTRKKLG